MPLRLKDGRLRIPGTTLLVDFNDWFESSLSAKETHTLAGFLTEIHSGVPKQGTQIEVGEFLFRVESTDARVVREVSIKADEALLQRLAEQEVL